MTLTKRQNIAKKLLKSLSKQNNVLPVFDVTEQTVLVMAGQTLDFITDP